MRDLAGAPVTKSWPGSWPDCGGLFSPSLFRRITGFAHLGWLWDETYPKHFFSHSRAKNWASWNRSLNLPSGSQKGVSALGPPQAPPSEVPHLGQEDAVRGAPRRLPHWEGRETQDSGTEKRVSNTHLYSASRGLRFPICELGSSKRLCLSCFLDSIPDSSPAVTRVRLQARSRRLPLSASHSPIRQI